MENVVTQVGSAHSSEPRKWFTLNNPRWSGNGTWGKKGRVTTTP